MKKKISNTQIFKKEKEIEIYLKEYEKLCAEIRSRLDAQTQITNLALLLLGGIIPAAVFVSDSQISNKIEVLLFGLLIISLLYISLQSSFLNHVLEIGRIGKYINGSTKSNVGQVIGIKNYDSLFAWERYHTKQQFPEKTFKKIAIIILSISQLALMLVPAIASLIYAINIYRSLYSFLPTDILGRISLGLIIFNIVYLLGSMITGWYSISIYREIR